MAELADAYVWGAYGEIRVGSSPILHTKQQDPVYGRVLFFYAGIRWPGYALGLSALIDSGFRTAAAQPPGKKGLCSGDRLDFFGTIDIALAYASLSSIPGIKKHLRLALNGELLYAESGSVFSWVFGGDLGRWQVCAVKHISAMKTERYIIREGPAAFIRKKKGLLLPRTAIIKQRSELTAKDIIILGWKNPPKVLIGGVVLDSVRVAIFYVISILLFSPLIRRIWNNIRRLERRYAGGQGVRDGAINKSVG